MLRLAVFASGGGSNVQALIDHFNQGNRDTARVCLVLSDRAEVGALTRATRAGIACAVIPVSGRDEDEVANAMHEQLEHARIDLVALAGYLKLIPPAVVRTYRHRMVNIHPALLPAFGGKGMYGLRVHRAVLESGCFVTGVTVHQVDERYDEGRPLLQWPVPVLAGDTAETLAARVLRVEHVVYPLAIEALARHIAEQPEAPFVGGFGPADAVGFSWTIDDSAAALSVAVRTALRLDSEGH
jgi:formyltetrahydrofolate-dependent phosphoribosylglycinamide formyltransferase